MKKVQKIARYGKIISVLVGVGIFILLFVLASREWSDIKNVLSATEWSRIPVIVLFTIISYALLLFGFVFIHRVYGFNLKTKELATIGYVSITLNHLMPLASVGGYSLRIFLLKKRGFIIRDSIVVSVLHSYFHNLFPFVLFPVAVVYLIARFQVSDFIYWALIVTMLISSCFFILINGIIFSSRVRNAVFNLFQHVLFFLTKTRREFLVHLSKSFARAMDVLKGNKGRFTIFTFILIIEWIVTMMVLDRCFQALGVEVSFLELGLGFFIGTSLGLFSLLPSGIGVQEGSMVLVFMLLGQSFEVAFLASVLFRLFYVLIPAGLGALLYWFAISFVSKEKREVLLRAD